MRGFSKEMTFEHRQQMMRVVNNMKMWGRSIPGRREKRYILRLGQDGMFEEYQEGHYGWSQVNKEENSRE